MTSPGLTSPAILDANAIIGVAKSGCFSLVPRLFSSIFVPPLVVLEVTDPVSQQELRVALPSWLTEAAPGPGGLQQVSAVLPPADRQVLALALDHRPCALVTGDRKLIRRAQQLGISSIIPEDVSRILAQAGLIVAAKPHLDQMRRLGFSIPEGVYQAILRQLGE